MPLPSLELNVELTTPDRIRYRWDANQTPANRPQNLSFRTKVGEGFSDAGLTLPRRIDLDYPDLELVNDVAIIGADGFVAYEGRVAAMPRELGDAHSINVTLAGWMAHAKDRKFTEIYVDTDLQGWGPMSARRRFNLLGANHTYNTAPEVKPDPSTSQPTVSTGWVGAWASPYLPQAEAWYDAGPEIRIGRVVFSWKRESAIVDPADAFWAWSANTCEQDTFDTGGFTSSGNLRAAGPSANQTLLSNALTHRYANLQLAYTFTPAGVDGGAIGIAWYNLAVFGTHNLTIYPGTDYPPGGPHTGDVVRDICRRWCPMLDPSGVQDTSYVIQQLAFKDPTYPYDAFLEVNKYHLWHLGVWEGKRLDFRPYDFSDYQWAVRTDDPNVTISLQGDSTEDLCNGVKVKYKDIITGVDAILSPDVYSDLKDTDPDNPWNRHGVEHWEDIELSTPTLFSQALQIGRLALADKNRPKAPGTITVKGHIRDRQGDWQPVWKVRAGDTIAITDFPNDSARLIVETDYTDDGKSISLAIDKPFQFLPAFLDRVSNALTARGLT